MKHFLLYIVIFFTVISAKSEVTIKNISQNSDTIFLGMTKANLIIETAFEIINNDDINYKIEKGNPSFIITSPLNISNNDFEEFEILNNSQIEIKAHSSVTFKVQFAPKENLTIYPLGNKTALLKIGLFPANSSMPNKKEDMAYYKEFILKAKKTALDLAFLDNVVQIDSVYIHPSNPIKLNFTLQSNTNDQLKLIKEEIFYTSENVINNEFIPKSNILLGEFNNIYETKIRSFEYYPLNRGWDTVDYRVVYQNKNKLNIDTVIFKFIAFGTEQNIVAQEAIDATIKNDTIFVNDVLVGSSTNFKLIISNQGNIPFGITAQSILKENSNQNEVSYTFDKYFLPSGKHLHINSTDTADIKFTPNESKTYIGRLIIRSDINTRNIQNINNSAREKIIYIKARGVAPEISLNTNSINFGNLNISDDCPQILDTSIIIYNPGNLNLRISKIELSPNIGIPFYFDNSEIFIPAGGIHPFNIKLDTKGLAIGQELNFDLKFINNSINNPNISLKLKLVSDNLQTVKISLPDTTKAKTGRIIKIPVLTEKNKIIKANSFHTSISYNKEILEFEGYETNNTASEPAIYASILDTGNTFLTIDCKSEISNFFLSDTLIILKFRTYLSDTYYTPIIFNNFIVGNEKCTNIYNTKFAESKGIFSIDSVCGLEFKVLKNNNHLIKNIATYPNPANDHINLEFIATKNGELNIEIFNQFGIKVQSINNIKYLIGDNSIYINLNNLPIALYYIRIKSNYFQEYIKLNIIQ